jgi:PAS domain-containing protein
MATLMQTFLVKLVALLIVGLVVVFVIDPLDPSTVSTPFLLGIVLMALSLRQDLSLVTAASIIFSILTAAALIDFRMYRDANFHASPHPYFWLFQRMGLFLVVCTLAIYLASYRADSERIRARIQNILAKLPAPVAISDAAGYVVYVNEALCRTLKEESSEIMGKRFVDFFMSDIQEGKAMRYYIELFAAAGDNVHELEIKPFNREAKTKARLTCFGTGSTRVMITLLLNTPAGSGNGTLIRN